jgi:hypothetical protein
LSTLKSIYAPKFKFNLIGDYGVDNIFLVHRICITCDDLAMLKENKLIRMLYHFDMTSNSGINFMPDSMLHDSFFKPVVACNFEILNFGVPTLGWFNDEHFSLHENINMCFTYTCKLGCNTCSWKSIHYLMSYCLSYLCSTLNVQYERFVKTDDIYIYHAHMLSLLLACLQNKLRRGRISFKEREDDVDMATSDTTKNMARGYIYQVISSSESKIYYLVIRDKKYFTYFSGMPNRRRLVQATGENARDRPASFHSREAVHDIQVLALVKV